MQAAGDAPLHGGLVQVDITVPMNSGDSVYDLCKVLPGWEGWRYQDPPRISVGRNTNRALVTTRLTDTELRLSYTAGMSGTALVTVGLTDAAGVSNRRSSSTLPSGPASWWGSRSTRRLGAAFHGQPARRLTSLTGRSSSSSEEQAR